MNTPPIHVTPYTRQHKRDLLRLMQYEDRLHIHLDWNTVDEWIGEPDMPIVLAWQGRQLIGVMGAAPPLGRSTWLRLVAMPDSVDVDEVLAVLWPALKAHLVSKQINEVAVLLLRPWIRPYVAKLGFAPLDSIVTLRRDDDRVLPPLRSDLKIRVADWREVSAATEVDHKAFTPIWQLSLSALRQAARTASRFTVAELDGQIVAYQLSTLYRDGAHLARLATVPTVQGQGIGGVLLTDVIEHFLRRNIHSITVNTQETNTKSLSLYHRYGFGLTGLNMDVWSLKI
ncbi:MAG: GNAT family N-acetyltransferase [Chloroflexota bacterium]